MYQLYGYRKHYRTGRNNKRWADPHHGGGEQKISFYQLLNTPISVGDEFLYGVWANSQTADGFNSSLPLAFSLNNGGYGSGETCASTGATTTTYSVCAHPDQVSQRNVPRQRHLW
jgi:hypothetical protein